MSNYTSTLWTKLYEEQLDKDNANEMDSTTKSDIELPPRNVSQRWRRYGHDAKRRVFERFSKWCPKGSATSNLFIYLKTDQTFPEFVLKSVMGFFGGIVLTYLCFVFFVFQLSISLIHATIMSSIIGVLLTFGLAFSYRIRCLVFLLIPQLFSRVGRYTLTCYALVLILTGPATNTLKNSEVLTESMACTQEQIKTDVNQITLSVKKPFSSMRDTIKVIIGSLNEIAHKVEGILGKINRLVIAIVDVLQASYSWLHSVVDECNKTFGTSREHCSKVLTNLKSQKIRRQHTWILPNTSYIVKAVCSTVNSNSKVCRVAEFAESSIAATIKRRLRTFTSRVKAMFFINLRMHHSYTFPTNTSRSPSQVTAGIVTEIRNRADPLLTWLSWSSCVTSLFLLLIIFRAKYYQHMFETRSRFDNRYITKELRDLDLQRSQEGRDTVLPLNTRERAKYVTTTSWRLVASERVHLTRSIVFMTITTFKLMIHMIADYSLYWVLMTIRYNGKRQTNLPPGPKDAGVLITGSGLIAEILRSIYKAFTIPLSEPPSSMSCLPDPYPPDLKRYTHIGVLIFLLWFFALFEPYGLRLRHLIMGHYRPERAAARAIWLYNHILRTRGSFMKFARRKLHKEYKYLPEEKLTFRYWLNTHIPFQWLRYILGVSPSKPRCLLCNAKEIESNPNTELIRCETQDCPGRFCVSCYSDIGQLCTICLTPVDYGDFSDISLEKYQESSDDSEDSSDCDKTNLRKKSKYIFKPKNSSDCNERNSLLNKMNQSNPRISRFYSSIKTNDNYDKTPLLDTSEDEFEQDICIKNTQVNALDLTHLAPKNNVTVGYVYQNYYCNENLVNLLPNLYKNDNKKSEEYNNNSYNKDNYDTFKNALEKDIKKDKKETCNNTFQNSNNINRNSKNTKRYKTVAKIKKKYGVKLKSRCKRFKIKRKKSQEYCQQQCDVLRQKMKQVFLHIKSSKTEISRKLEDTGVFRLNQYETKSFAIKSIPGKYSRSQIYGSKATYTKTNNSKQDRCPKKNVNSGLPLREIDNKLGTQSNLPYEPVNINQHKKLKSNLGSVCFGKCRKLFCLHLLKLRLFFKSNRKIKKYSNEDSLPFLKYKTNYKRRKKYNNNVINKENSRNKIRKIRKDIEITRKYRIYTFLKEGEWIKGHFGRDSTQGTNVFTAHNAENCYGDTKTKLQDYGKTNTLDDNNESSSHICNCMNPVCCDCDCNCKSNTNIDSKASVCNKTSTSSEAEDLIKNMKFFKRDDDISLKSIDHVHVPLLSKCLSPNKMCDIAQLSSSVKSFSIKNVKMYISNKFLHLQFRNPVSILKSLLSPMSFTKQNVSTIDKKDTVDKDVYVLPEIGSCACQCEIISRTLMSPEIKRSSKNPKIDYKYTDDKQMRTKTKTRNSKQYAPKNRNKSNDTTEISKIDCPCKEYGKVKKTTSYTSDSTKTDTTVCSRITVDYVDETPKAKAKKPGKKFKLNVITKSNQSTITDQANCCDMSTLTSDWWSPIVEKKEMDFKRDDIYKKDRKSVKTSIDGRIVAFKSRVQIIPANNSYILSPSRYLLESQKYYNELFTPRFYAPHLFPVIRTNKKQKVSTKRINKNHKTKRLNERRSSGLQLNSKRFNISTSRSDETTNFSY